METLNEYLARRLVEGTLGHFSALHDEWLQQTRNTSTQPTQQTKGNNK
jgi:hypothetical protein